MSASYEGVRKLSAADSVEALHPQRGRSRTLARQFPAWQVEHKAIRPDAHA